MIGTVSALPRRTSGTGLLISEALLLLDAVRQFLPYPAHADSQRILGNAQLVRKLLALFNFLGAFRRVKRLNEPAFLLRQAFEALIEVLRECFAHVLPECFRQRGSLIRIRFGEIALAPALAPVLFEEVLGDAVGEGLEALDIRLSADVLKKPAEDFIRQVFWIVHVIPFEIPDQRAPE